MPRPSIAVERREEILAAFEVCAVRKGLATTTLADVAEEAGLPRPLVRHFMGNRADMVTGLIERMMLRASGAIDAALEAAGEQRDEELLQIVLSKSFVDPITNRLMIQLWQQAWQDRKLQVQLEDVYRRCVEQIHDRVFSKPSQSSYELAYALAAMALGNAVFNQFNVGPGSDAAFVAVGKALTELPMNRVFSELSS